MKTLENAKVAEAAGNDDTVVVFVHVEPRDIGAGGAIETKLVKNTKWLARKWNTINIILHSFTHLGEEKAEPSQAKALLDRAKIRLTKAGYSVVQTPYGYFLNLTLEAPGHPLARIYKEF